MVVVTGSRPRRSRAGASPGSNPARSAWPSSTPRSPAATRSLLRERLGISADRPVIGHLATLDPNKGTNDLVLAVARLNRRGPSTTRSTSFWPVRARLISSGSWPRCPGGGPPGCGCSGRCPRTRTADFYAALDLFAMPSRTDSFGIVFLEGLFLLLAQLTTFAG